MKLRNSIRTSGRSSDKVQSHGGTVGRIGRVTLRSDIQKRTHTVKSAKSQRTRQNQICLRVHHVHSSSQIRPHSKNHAEEFAIRSPKSSVLTQFPSSNNNDRVLRSRNVNCNAIDNFVKSSCNSSSRKNEKSSSKPNKFSIPSSLLPRKLRQRSVNRDRDEPIPIHGSASRSNSYEIKTRSKVRQKVLPAAVLTTSKSEKTAPIYAVKSASTSSITSCCTPVTSFQHEHSHKAQSHNSSLQLKETDKKNNPVSLSLTQESPSSCSNQNMSEDGPTLTQYPVSVVSSAPYLQQQSYSLYSQNTEFFPYYSEACNVSDGNSSCAPVDLKRNITPEKCMEDSPSCYEAGATDEVINSTLPVVDAVPEPSLSIENYVNESQLPLALSTTVDGAQAESSSSAGN